MITWGVLGTAGIAYTQTIPGMKAADNCNLYAIAGRNMDKAQKFKDEFGFEKAYGSYEELLADEKVDAVYIPLPNHIHSLWIKKAADAGKHILCEKPMCMNPQELEETFDYCSQRGVLLMEAFAYLHNDAIEAMIEHVAKGELGKIRLIEACFFTGPPRPEDFRWVKEYGGGAVYDLGCYSISLAQRMLGVMPESIDAMGHLTEAGIDDFCQMYLRYQGGAQATLGCGFVARGRSDRMIIHGDRASLVADIVFNQEGLCCFDIISDEESRHFEFNVKSNYALEIEQMGRCIENGEQPHISRDFSMNVAKIISEVCKKIGYE